MENLLSTPVHPGEVIIGKIVPYIIVGYVQVFLILLAAKFLFNVPIVGSVPLLLVLTFLFIVANLAVGITFSTIAKNQLQAVQMAFFFFLPSLLLSGYMFPFRGMPGWAQDIGECLPLTHFLRVVRGILLKGKRPGGNRAGPVADCAVSGRDADHWHQTLPADAGLSGRIRRRNLLDYNGFKFPAELANCAGFGSHLPNVAM